MIFSAQQRFSNAQAVTATAVSENIIDLGATGTVAGQTGALSRDIGPGEPIDLLVQVVEDFATLTSLTVTLQVDDNSSFSSAKEITIADAVPVADLVAGYKSNIRYVPDGVDERYIRLNYTVAGTNATAGKITAGIVMGVQTNA